MKKVLFAVAALALSAGALADAGVYVQGDLGSARIVTDDDSVSRFSPRLSVGYDFGNNIRAAVDYTYYKSEKYNDQSADGWGKGETKFNSIGASVFYDFPVHEQVKPYVGARLGVNKVSAEYIDIDGKEKYSASKTGFGVILGVGYNVTENVALDAGYRYNYWGNYGEEGERYKFKSHELSAGVRVKF